MTSNSSRSRVLNLVYRLVNAFEGKNADIERSGLYRHYDVNKYSVKVSLNNRKTKVLKERLENALLSKGFVNHNIGKTYHCFMSPDGVAINITNTEDFLNRNALDVFIY